MRRAAQGGPSRSSAGESVHPITLPRTRQEADVQRASLCAILPEASESKGRSRDLRTTARVWQKQPGACRKPGNPRECLIP